MQLKERYIIINYINISYFYNNSLYINRYTYIPTFLGIVNDITFLNCYNNYAISYIPLYIG